MPSKINKLKQINYNCFYSSNILEDLEVVFQGIMLLVTLFITFRVTNCQEYDVLILGAGASGLGKNTAQNAEVSLD